MKSLQEIGQQLDKNIFPIVFNSGIVTPNTTSVPLLILGEDNYHETQRARRPPTRSWPWSAGWQRETNGQRAPHHTPSLIGASLQENYADQLEVINDAYPNTKVWQREDGLWIQSQSSLLPDFWHEAVFLTVFPYNGLVPVKSWGFWSGGILEKPVWIGPRHTNFPDGSICAFEPADGTWKPGDSVVTLLDMYSLWAVRHLHLEFHGRWPGQQSIPYAHERITEQKANELCGCGKFGKTYNECCQSSDLSRDLIGEMVKFLIFTNFQTRRPPEAIIRCVCEHTVPPPIRSVY